MAPLKPTVLGGAVVLLSALAGANESGVPTFSHHSPPAYPAPIGHGNGLPGWSEAYSKAQAIVAQMTLAEKVNLTTGTGWQSEGCVGNTGSIPRLGLRGLCLQDSPLGIRLGLYSSAFPAGVTIASTWDEGLAYRRGFAMGMEHRGKGVDIQLGPVSGPLGLFPEGGRNWEGAGSDPHLSGNGLAAAVRGIQDAGVIACAKHYIANEQEHFRLPGENPIEIKESISSNVDDRTMHEVYAWPFADAVRAGVGAIMCSIEILTIRYGRYPMRCKQTAILPVHKAADKDKINNSYGCQNSELLNGILKNELGFQGFVLSDWQAQHGGVATALAGLDMTMPGDQKFLTHTSYWGGNLTVAVLNGSVPTWRLDDMATRIMASFYKVGRDKTQVDVNLNSWTKDVYGYQNFYAKENYRIVNGNVDVRGTHGQLIREIAAKGTVILKNKGSLPLGKPRQIAVFGSDATDNPRGPNSCDDRGCSDGTVAMGWGSGTANFPYLISPLTALQNRAYQDNSVIQWVVDDYATEHMDATARQADTCLVFVKADAGEGYLTVDGNNGDRNNLTLWANGEHVIKTVAGNCSNTIVTVHAPGPVLMEEWIDHPNVTAVLFAGLPGQESGNSIVDVLYGHVEPGRLPFTIAKSAEDYGVKLMYKPDNSYAPQQDFTSGLMIDYRHFDKQNIKPRFEFGFGLSYSNWTYKSITVRKTSAGPYTPFSGRTPAANSKNVTETPSDLLFPPGFHQVPGYIYPYLSSTTQYGLTGNGTNGPAEGYNPTGTPIRPAGGAPGGNPQLYDVLWQVNVTVANSGSRNGEEIVQLYVSQGEQDDPVRVLRGFRRVSVDAGGWTSVIFDITRRDVARWDVASQDWLVTAAKKKVYVGRSSRDLPLVADLD
ncbi:hypothetical protein Dda_4780 [Drechslerella dactyloides]|uniref:beta-glucosidase n=1 Tax=Drechslerella dactyloides TaxID=74499 RepID=A0AAD6IYZ4_DREDA|nr:hypothetical protein Dda_4780 [Drechslerella dactyloides]